MNDEPRDGRDPVLVERLRGGFVESRHRGSVAIVDRRRTVFAAGDPGAPMFVRSAAKPFQLLAALEAGALDATDPSPRELALMAASHNGEPEHVDLVRGLLRRAGIDESLLACGTHRSISPDAADRQARSGEPLRAVHNNCSGKHAAMLLLARRLGADLATYLEPEHPAQQAILRAVKHALDLSDPFPQTAVDGCSAPTFRLPLCALARGYLRLIDPHGLPRALAEPLGRIRDAMLGEPFFVAGRGRVDTEVIAAGHGRILSKVGAEGVLAGAVRDRDGRGTLGVAVKISDGSAAACEALFVALLDALDALDDEARSTLARRLDRSIRNHRGLVTGEVRFPILP